VFLFPGKVFVLVYWLQANNLMYVKSNKRGLASVGGEMGLVEGFGSCFEGSKNLLESQNSAQLIQVVECFVED
jgi:hypothetical protein